MPQRTLDELYAELHRLTGWRFWVYPALTGTLSALVVLAVALPLVQSSNRDAVRDARGALAEGQRKGCQRTNLKEAQNRSIVGGSLRQLRDIYAIPRPVIWCEKTYTSSNAGERVYLVPGPLAECYLRLSLTDRHFARSPFSGRAQLERVC